MEFVFYWLMLFDANANSLVLEDRVDRIELNHYYDENSVHVFDQLIFYDWSGRANRFQVRAWRLVKSPSQIPVKSHHHNKWHVMWHDTGVLRKVVSNSFIETWTKYDPELLERQFLPQEQRGELKKLDHSPPIDLFR